MSSRTATTVTTAPTVKRYTRHRRRRISIDGDELIPRSELAEELGITERTLQKLRVPVTSIGNVAYLRRNATIKTYLATHTRCQQGGVAPFCAPARRLSVRFLRSRRRKKPLFLGL